MFIVENLWHYLRSHYWSNRTYADYDALRLAAIDAWQKATPDPTSTTYSQKRAYFKRLTSIAAAKGSKPGWASYRFRDVFGRWPMGFVQAVREEVAAERQPDASDVEAAPSRATFRG